MKKSTKKIIIFTNIIFIMFCITISFAWMDDMVGYTTNRFIEMIFGKDINGNKSDTHLYVAPNSIDVELYVENNDRYELISNRNVDNIYSKNNFAPDDIIRYNMIITNKTLVDANVAVMLTNITTDYDKIFDYVYVGIISSKGFDYPYEPPIIGTDESVNEFRLADKISDSGVTDGETQNPEDMKKASNLIDSVIIPSATLNNKTGLPEYHTVEIRFYIRIDHTAKNDIQGKFLRIENLSFMVA